MLQQCPGRVGWAPPSGGVTASSASVLPTSNTYRLDSRAADEALPVSMLELIPMRFSLPAT